MSHYAANGSASATWSTGPMKSQLVSPQPQTTPLYANGNSIPSAILSPHRTISDYQQPINNGAWAGGIRLPIVPHVHHPTPVSDWTSPTNGHTNFMAQRQQQQTASSYAAALLSPNNQLHMNGSNRSLITSPVNDMRWNASMNQGPNTAAALVSPPLPHHVSNNGQQSVQRPTPFSPQMNGTQVQWQSQQLHTALTLPAMNPRSDDTQTVIKPTTDVLSTIINTVVVNHKPLTEQHLLSVDVTNQPKRLDHVSSSTNGDDSSGEKSTDTVVRQSETTTTTICATSDAPKQPVSANTSPDTTHSPSDPLTIATEDAEVDIKPSPVVSQNIAPPLQLTGSVHRAPGMSRILPGSNGPPTLVTIASTLNANQPGIQSGANPNATVTANGTLYTCPICGFSSASKFHFNSHMNTHTDHQCSMCDYTSRTEGRLKRHMKEFHSREEQAVAGISPMPEDNTNHSITPTPPTFMGDMGAPNINMLDMNALQQMQALTARADNSMATSIADVATAATANHATPRTPMGGDGDSGGRQSTAGSNGTTPSGSTPPRRAHSSKPKSYRCKQCGLVLLNKEESWSHARSHIPQDKQLTCPKCDFVTEYKHHLEYHLRNHFGSKPFQCIKCKYTCVNKSMLNSHMKSHSNVYQFRCQDCTYATKYCHSLKLHLRKYGHRPSTIISADGTSIDPHTFEVINHRTGKKGNGRASLSTTPPSAPPPTMAPGGTPYLPMVGMNQLTSPPPTTSSTSSMGGQFMNMPPDAMQQFGSRGPPPHLPLANLLAQQRGPFETAALMQRLQSLGMQLPPLPMRMPPQDHSMHPSLGQMGSAFGPPSSSEPPVNCPICRLECGSRSELLKHHIQTHVSDLANIYNLQRLQQAMTNSGATSMSQMTTTTSALSSVQNQLTSPMQNVNSAIDDEDTTSQSPLINIDDQPTGNEVTGRNDYSPKKEESSESGESTNTPTTGDSSTPQDGQHKRKRKGQAFKLDQISKRLQQQGGSNSPQSHSSDNDNDSPQLSDGHVGGVAAKVARTADSSPSSATSAVVPPAPAASSPAAYLAALNMAIRRNNSGANSSSPSIERSSLNAAALAMAMQHRQQQVGTAGGVRRYSFICDHCRIAFEDQVMYHIHMGYHGYDDPFKCNRCGHASPDALAHNLHLLQAKHD